MEYPTIYIHVYEDPQKRLYCLEQAPVPATFSEARVALLEQDAFWSEYRFTVKLTGTTASYVDIASAAEEDSRPGGASNSLPEDASWRLQTASVRYRPPERT